MEAIPRETAHERFKLLNLLKASYNTNMVTPESQTPDTSSAEDLAATFYVTPDYQQVLAAVRAIKTETNLSDYEKQVKAAAEMGTLKTLLDKKTTNTKQAADLFALVCQQIVIDAGLLK